MAEEYVPGILGNPVDDCWPLGLEGLASPLLKVLISGADSWCWVLIRGCGEGGEGGGGGGAAAAD